MGHHAKAAKGVGALGDLFFGHIYSFADLLPLRSLRENVGHHAKDAKGVGALGICFLGMMQKNIPLRTYLLCGLCVMRGRCGSEAMDYALHSIGQYRITEIKKKTQMFIGYFQIG